MQPFTFIVAGAGMIGLATAIGLQQAGHRVIVIERGDRPEYGSTPELRVSALAHSSRRLLERLGSWQQMPASRLGPYTGMRVWDYDSFGRIEFYASELALADIGAIVENKVLEQVLWDQAVAAGVSIMATTELVQQQVDDQRIQVTLANGQTLTGDYLIAADGARSTVRAQANLPLTFWDYQQQAQVAVLTTELPHQGIARQVFLPTGPLALLPLADANQVSIVWSADTERAQQLSTLSDSDFIRQLQVASDNCLGLLQLQSARATFPLRMQYCQRWVQQRLLVLGDAAHSIHPLAGQGANLGFADVADLLAIFAHPELQVATLPKQLRQWERQRKAAAVTMIGAMESFKRGFAGSAPWVKLGRGLALQLAHRVTPLKQQLMRAALGA